MDIISFNEAATANSRVEIINANPDSTSGVVTVPSTIATGETITVPAGRTAILPDITVEGDLVVEGNVFIPTGSTYTQDTIKTEAISNVAGTTVVDVTDIVSKVGDQTIAGTKTFSISPVVPTPTVGDNSTKVATTAYVDGKFIRGTAVATTSGTAVDFTGIPSWAKRITVMLNAVSTNGTSSPTLRVGTSSGIVSAGYTSDTTSTTGSSVSGSNTTSGVNLVASGHLASYSYSGIITLVLIDTNVWVITGISNIYQVATCNYSSKVILSATLDRLRITTINGTDTFDTGSINIMYEG